MMTSKLELRKLIQIPPALLKALGEVSVRYGQIEHILAMTIHRTEGVSYDDAFLEMEKLQGQKDIRKKVKQSFRDWAAKKFDATEGQKCGDAFSDLIQHWVDLANRRHDVIHCCWSVRNDKPTATRKGKNLKWDGRSVGIEDVEKMGENLKQFLVLLNNATLPSGLSGLGEEVATIPAAFSPDFTIPVSIETESTAASSTSMAAFPKVLNKD